MVNLSTLKGHVHYKTDKFQGQFKKFLEKMYFVWNAGKTNMKIIIIILFLDNKIWMNIEYLSIYYVFYIKKTRKKYLKNERHKQKITEKTT